MSSTAEKTIISAAVGDVNLTVCMMEKVGKKAVQKLLYDCSEMQFRCKNPSEIKKNSRIQSRQKSNFEFQPKNSRANTVEYIPAEKRWNPTEQEIQHNILI